VFKRPLAFLAILFVSVVVAPATLAPAAHARAAVAAVVHVRVEGKTTTIFGATEPRALANTALDALEAASLGGEFYYHVTQSSFGPYVDQIGRYPASGSSGWAFKVDGVVAQVGADKVQLHDGDTVVWYWATFGPNGGPPTLELKRSTRGCYQVFEQDDAGKETPAAHAVLHVDRRAIKAAVGQNCIGPHRGLVRASEPGAVRSNALA